MMCAAVILGSDPRDRAFESPPAHHLSYSDTCCYMSLRGIIDDTVLRAVVSWIPISRFQQEPLSVWS